MKKPYPWVVGIVLHDGPFATTLQQVRQVAERLSTIEPGNASRVASSGANLAKKRH